jgi:hypothetical protein
MSNCSTSSYFHHGFIERHSFAHFRHSLSFGFTSLFSLYSHSDSNGYFQNDPKLFSIKFCHFLSSVETFISISDHILSYGDDQPLFSSFLLLQLISHFSEFVLFDLFKERPLMQLKSPIFTLKVIIIQLEVFTSYGLKMVFLILHKLFLFRRFGGNTGTILFNKVMLNLFCIKYFIIMLF